MFFRQRKKAVIVKYPELLSADDIENIFQGQGEDSKIWQALDSILDQNLLNAVSDVSNEKNDLGKYAHAAGRVDAISDIKATIQQLRSWKSGKKS